MTIEERIAAARGATWRTGHAVEPVLRHHLNDLIDLAEGLQAENAVLFKSVDENWVSHQRVVSAEKERDAAWNAAIEAAAEYVDSRHRGNLPKHLVSLDGDAIRALRRDTA